MSCATSSHAVATAVIADLHKPDEHGRKNPSWLTLAAKCLWPSLRSGMDSAVGPLVRRLTTDPVDRVNWDPRAGEQMSQQLPVAINTDKPAAIPFRPL